MVDVARHARHISLPQVGYDGQLRLKDAKVLIIGAGGLGSPVALYLAAAGIGCLGLVDGDRVELSNLQRQILHSTAQIGRLKVESAQDRIASLDNTIETRIYTTHLKPDNVLGIMKDYDIVIDGTDNLPTRYLIDDAASILGKPWVYGSVFRFEGQVSLFNHKGGPQYRDLFPIAPPAGAVPSCTDAGVLGVLPGTIGLLQATEAIKVILGIEASLSGVLLIYDALKMSFTSLSFSKDIHRQPITDLAQSTAMFKDEAWCVLTPLLGDSSQQSKSESAGKELMFNRISVSEVLQRRAQGWQPFILDVRSDAEFAQGHLRGCDIQVPHTQVLSVLDELPQDGDILIHCMGGMRSQMAAIELINAGCAGQRIFNLEGGIMAWQAASPQDIVR